MNASKAAKRMSLLMLTLALIVMTTTAIAKDDEHGYLGVMLQNITSSMSKALQLDEDEGVMIDKVVADGPAAEAGLEDGDIILNFNGKNIDSFETLTKAVRATSAGDLVDVEILHNGTRQTAQIKMGEGKSKSFSYTMDFHGDAPEVEVYWESDDDVAFMSDDGGSFTQFFGDDGKHEVIVMSGDGHSRSWTSNGDDSFKMDMLFVGGDRGFMGVELDDLNEQMGEYFGVDDGEGALINVVHEDSAAEEAGLKAGDVIVEVNGETVEDSSDVHEAMADTEPEQEIEIKVVRKGKNKTIKVTLGEAPENEFVQIMRAPHAPRMMGEFHHQFPGRSRHNVRVIAPHSSGDLHRVIELHENSEDLDELREELEELKAQLEEFKDELEK